MEMAMNSMVGSEELRRQHEESARVAQAARAKEWSSFRERLTDGRRLAFKTIFWFGVLIVTFNYRNQIAEFLTPAAKNVLVHVQHLGDHGKLQQAITKPDNDLADLTH